MRLTASRTRLLRSLVENKGSLRWEAIGPVGKTASAYLRQHKLADLTLDAKAIPSTMWLNITDAGRAALEQR